MRKLMALELKKFKLFSYLKGVIIANLVILGLVLGLINSDESFKSYGGAFQGIEVFSRSTFTIFASVLLARLIIEEYQTNSITLMFMYPINRKKIMIAKLAIVACFTFLSIFISNIVLGSAFYGINQMIHVVPSDLPMEVIKKAFITMSFGAVASMGMSLIPLYFGMLKKSVPATIVAAVIMESLTSSTNAGVTAFSIIAIPISLALVGFVIAYFSIHNVEKVDV